MKGFMRNSIVRQKLLQKQNATPDIHLKSQILKIQQQHEEKKTFFVSPNTLFGFLWSCIIVLYTIYNIMLVPIRIAFFENCPIRYTLIVDYIGDLVFICDVVLRAFFFAYYDGDDLITARAKITHRYIWDRESYIIFHFVSILPFDFLLYRGPIGSFSLFQALFLLRWNKICRLVDVHVHIDSIEKTIMKHGFKLNRNILSILKLIFVVFLTAHFIGCIFYIMANTEHLSGNNFNWADNINLIRDCTFGIEKSSLPTTANPTPCLNRYCIGRIYARICYYI